MPPELAQQLPVLKELLVALGYKIISLEGYEADDILGTVAEMCKNGDECYIATGDRDSFQLIRDNVTVLLPHTKMGTTTTEIYTPARIQEEYGVTPIQMIDIKALQGDASDCIPGVAGVGEKTADLIVERFGADALQILEKQPERLLEIRGITPAKLEEIKAFVAKVEAKVKAIVEKIKAVVDTYPKDEIPTEFEIVTTMAFYYYCDFCSISAWCYF
mgnify:CR=1 FL=1